MELSGLMVDSNVILDVATEDPSWAEWSAGKLEELAERYPLVINPIIYSEVSVGYERIEDLEAALPEHLFRREPLPWEAAFLAGKCFLAYRRADGTRRSPLPDFYIGAHAAVSGYGLLTRDGRRYQKYLPKLKLFSPRAE